MANIIQIKRGASDGSLIPTTLAIGELAYAENGTKLYIGESGNTITPIGGKIGVTVQGYDAGLNSIAGLTTAANKMIYTTALDTYTTTDLTATAITLLGGATAATMRTTLGAAGTAEATSSVAGLMSAADKGSLDTLAAYIAADAAIVATDYDTFDTVSAYSKGDIVNYFGAAYRFTVDHAAGVWNGDEVITYTGVIDKLQEVFTLFETYSEVSDIATLLVAPTEMTLDGGSF